MNDPINKWMYEQIYADRAFSRKLEESTAAFTENSSEIEPLGQKIA